MGNETAGARAMAAATQLEKIGLLEIKLGLALSLANCSGN